MRIYFNKKIAFGDPRKYPTLWRACNGRTQRRLVLVNRLGEIKEGKTDCVSGAGLKKVTKPHTSMLLVVKNYQEKTLGVFLCSEYGYTVIRGKELWSASSIGGYGNSESRMGVYEVGVIIKTHTYKNRRPETFWELTEEGWKLLGEDAIVDENEVQDVV